jgi:hypothetical protein
MTGGFGVANEQNLKPFTSDQSREEAAKNGRKGGIASGESKRRRKSMRQSIEEILRMQIVDPKLVKQMELMGFSKDDITYQTAVNVARIQQAMAGNTKAIDSIDELLDEGIKSKQLKETKRNNKVKEKNERDRIAAMSKVAENANSHDAMDNLLRLMAQSKSAGLGEDD